MQSNQLDYLPIVMQVGLAVGFVVMTIIVSNFLGPKRHSKNKDKNFRMRNRIHRKCSYSFFGKIFSCCNTICAF
jgi:NADH:ubiquinone oxidoreductase subunit 3 (subunit A)